MQGHLPSGMPMRPFENNVANEHELYLKLFITCCGGL
jgi:hypothetical protein